MLSSDIGSIPPIKEIKLIWKGANKTNSLLPFLGVSDKEYEAFKEAITTTFVDKLNAGVDVPNYPQFRDMNEMFFALMNGIKKTEQGMVAVKRIKAKLVMNYKKFSFKPSPFIYTNKTKNGRCFHLHHSKSVPWITFI